MSDSLQPHGLYSPWNSPGQNTGVGSLSLLQWIFPIQESNWGLLHCRQILYQLSYQGSPVTNLDSILKSRDITLPTKVRLVKAMGFPGSSAGKESACNAGDPSLIPELRRYPGERIGYPLQYSWAVVFPVVMYGWM